jgi:hypothetical protein
MDEKIFTIFGSEKKFIRQPFDINIKPNITFYNKQKINKVQQNIKWQNNHKLLWFEKDKCHWNSSFWK